MTKRKQSNKFTKKEIFIFAFIVSFILFIVGVFSGLNTSTVIKEQVTLDLNDFKEDLDIFSLDVKNIQLQQDFVNYFGSDDCKFMNIYLDNLYTQLEYYWTVLPKRLESYDESTQNSDEYIALKREYIRFRFRRWLKYSCCSARH